MLEPVQTRSAEARRAGRAHRGDRPADRARAAPRRAIELTGTSWRHHGSDACSAGVEIQVHGGAHARVWAPACSSVDVVLDADRQPVLAAGQRVPTATSPATLPDARAGDRYWFRLDGALLRPDPVSRFQPDGPHGPSAVVDPSAFRWTDGGWRGVRPIGQVIYEMHVGTFTPEGTWRAAAAELRRARRSRHHDRRDDADRRLRRPLRLGLRRRRSLRARRASTARPTICAAFVDRAHALGLGVILDVVYNHLGPDGNYLVGLLARLLHATATRTTGARRSTSRRPPPARAFFVENAGYWIDEFHFDGLRLDATQDIHDASPEHVVAELIREARARRPASRADLRRRRERAAGHAPRSRPGAGRLRRATRSGTTTSITPRSSR